MMMLSLLLLVLLLLGSSVTARLALAAGDEFEWLDTSLPGYTRSVVKDDHALITADSFVYSPHPDWNATHTSGAIIIAPSMHHSKVKFSMYLINVPESGTIGEENDRVLYDVNSIVRDGDETMEMSETAKTRKLLQRFVYVLSGSIVIQAEEETTKSGTDTKRTVLGEDCYVYLSPLSRTKILSNGNGNAQLLVYDSLYQSDGAQAECDTTGKSIVQDHFGCVENVPLTPCKGEVFRLRKLMPTSMAHDFNIHIMDFDPGEYLNVKEVHYNQHGLWMRKGRGIYRLGENWYPVAEGDAIFMAPFVPQWYGALGTSPTRYILYKDNNRDPLIFY